MKLGRYEDKIDAKIEEWNARIEHLKICAHDLPPDNVPLVKLEV